jgi:hypothetical protein
MEPTQANAYIQMGNFYHRQLKQPEQAQRYYQQAALIWPESLRLRQRLDQ